MSAEIGTGSFSRIAAITLAALLPSKACWPVSISYSTSPNAKMSVRSSGRLPVDLLRGHVPRRAQDRPSLGQRRVTLFRPRPGRKALGQAEVEHLHPALRQQDVRGLQVAVDDAVAVRVLERVGDLAGQAQHVATGSGPRSAFPSTYSITR